MRPTSYGSRIENGHQVWLKELDLPSGVVSGLRTYLTPPSQDMVYMAHDILYEGEFGRGA